MTNLVQHAGPLEEALYAETGAHVPDHIVRSYTAGALRQLSERDSGFVPINVTLDAESKYDKAPNVEVELLAVLDNRAAGLKNTKIGSWRTLGRLALDLTNGLPTNNMVIESIPDELFVQDEHTSPVYLLARSHVNGHRWSEINYHLASMYQLDRDVYRAWTKSQSITGGTNDLEVIRGFERIEGQ